jgi:hypothetical protein
LQTNIKIQEFDKEDEKWWDGAWTSEMQIACSNLLRKIRRNRISGIFLSPVDPNESRRTLDFFEFISMHATATLDSASMPRSNILRSEARLEHVPLLTAHVWSSLLSGP